MWKKKFNKAKHIEDFLDLSCGNLNFFLQQRAILVGGNHQSDLAARALVAFEQNIPVKRSEDCAKDLRHEHSYPACWLILQPRAQQQKSYLKDTTNFINSLIPKRLLEKALKGL